MMKTDIAELVFIPAPSAGHLGSTIEFAKILIGRDDRLSISVLVMKYPYDHHTQLLVSDEERIRFVYLPDGEIKPTSLGQFYTEFVGGYKQHVREHVLSNMTTTTSTGSAHGFENCRRPRLAGFVVDVFCTSMMDIADEFRVPTYVFYTSNASLLGLMFHLQNLYDHHNHDVTEFKDSPVGKFLSVPAFTKPFPADVLPDVVLNRESSTLFLSITRRLRDTKGILVNTFTEIESHALNSFLNDDSIPSVYPVGPVLNLDLKVKDGGDTIMRWLDIQPPSSVVFLCFGSMGSFPNEQVTEIAHALESSGHRFLWSLRRPPPPPPEEGKKIFHEPGDYEDPSEILPEGFLERTAKIGKVIGWAPQVAVLSHPAVGGFVSHCGWNSTLESLWFGVPMATWPLYAKQQMNAFELVREFRLAVEIILDYRRDDTTRPVVTAAVIESGVRKLMDFDESLEIRQKVKEMSHKSKIAVEEGGSSYNGIGRFIEDVINGAE